MNIKYFQENFPKVYESVKNKLKEMNGVVYTDIEEKEDYTLRPIVLYPGLTEEEVQELEKKLNTKFPKEYREFLLNHNGGEIQNSLDVWGMAKVYNKDEFFEHEKDITSLQSDGRLGFDNIPENNIIIAGDDIGMSYALDPESGIVTSYDTEFPDNPKQLGTFRNFITRYFLEYPE